MSRRCQRLAFHSYDGPMDRRLSPRKISFTDVQYRKPGKPGRICAGCHVGSPADDEHLLRDVNHDLIAAGHPRLDFSFSAYLNLMPKHWPDGPRRQDSRPAHYGFRPDSETHAETWAIGQAVTAQAALELLAYRAGSDEKLANGANKEHLAPAPWPEFSEYDCYACHHQLDNSFPSSRQKAAQRRAGTDQLGSLRWGTWCFPEVRLLIGSQPFGAWPKDFSKPLADLTAEMKKSPSTLDRKIVQRLAADAASNMGELADFLDRRKFDQAAIDLLLQLRRQSAIRSG